MNRSELIKFYKDTDRFLKEIYSSLDLDELKSIERCDLYCEGIKFKSTLDKVISDLGVRYDELHDFNKVSNEMYFESN